MLHEHDGAADVAGKLVEGGGEADEGVCDGGAGDLGRGGMRVWRLRRSAGLRGGGLGCGLRGLGLRRGLAVQEAGELGAEVYQAVQGAAVTLRFGGVSSRGVGV